MLVLCSDTDDVHYTDENAHWRKAPQMIVILFEEEGMSRGGGEESKCWCFAVTQMKIPNRL